MSDVLRYHLNLINVIKVYLITFHNIRRFYYYWVPFETELIKVKEVCFHVNRSNRSLPDAFHVALMQCRFTTPFKTLLCR